MNFLFFAASTGSASGQPNGTVQLLVSLIPLLLIFVIFYFLFLRPQNKREKKIQQMRNNIQVGDEVTTSGGIIGRVVSIREDTVVLETGSDRSKIRIKRWAIQSNETIHENEESK